MKMSMHYIREAKSLLSYIYVYSVMSIKNKTKILFGLTATKISYIPHKLELVLLVAKTAENSYKIRFHSCKKYVAAGHYKSSLGMLLL